MKGFYLYMFLNKEEIPLYIGMSMNLTTRIETNHFGSENGNLSKECILETHRILYHEALSIDDMKIKERYLINTLRPNYNKKLNNDSKFSFTIDLNWKLYSIDKISLMEKQKERRPKRGIDYTVCIQKTIDAWLPYGVNLQYKKINYLIIKSLKEKVEIYSSSYDHHISYFFKINGELYIHNHEYLSYYTAHYREICKALHLDKKKDFLNITAPVDNKLFRSISDADLESGEYIRGACFMRYELVKTLNLIEEKTLNIFDKKLDKYFRPNENI